ncbi:NAD(P)-binding protein, partial [Aureobasidium melanogenum]
MSAKSEQDLLLVTCASGKQGTGLLPHIAKKWKRLRLHAGSGASKERLQKQYPSAEVIVGDMADPTTAPKLLEGVTCCFMVCPPLQHETMAIYHMIDAAVAQRAAGGPFAHMVYSSVIFPILRKLLNHDNKRYAEEYLIESGLPYTILQPTHMMENFPMEKVVREAEPVYPSPYNPEIVFTWVTAKDVGEAAACVIEERQKHFYATYSLVGTEPATYTEAVRQVSRVIGKGIRIKRIPLEQAVDGLVRRNKNESMRPFATRLLVYYNERGLIGNTNVLEMLLGRKPTSYVEWAKLKANEIMDEPTDST